MIFTRFKINMKQYLLNICFLFIFLYLSTTYAGVKITYEKINPFICPDCQIRFENIFEEVIYQYLQNKRSNTQITDFWMLPLSTQEDLTETTNRIILTEFSNLIFHNKLKNLDKFEVHSKKYNEIYFALKKNIETFINKLLLIEYRLFFQKSSNMPFEVNNSDHKIYAYHLISPKFSLKFNDTNESSKKISSYQLEPGDIKIFLDNTQDRVSVGGSIVHELTHVFGNTSYQYVQKYQNQWTIFDDLAFEYRGLLVDMAFTKYYKRILKEQGIEYKILTRKILKNEEKIIHSLINSFKSTHYNPNINKQPAINENSIKLFTFCDSQNFMDFDFKDVKQNNSNSENLTQSNLNSLNNYRNFFENLFNWDQTSTIMPDCYLIKAIFLASSKNSPLLSNESLLLKKSDEFNMSPILNQKDIDKIKNRLTNSNNKKDKIKNGLELLNKVQIEFVNNISKTENKNILSKNNLEFIALSKFLSWYFEFENLNSTQEELEENLFDLNLDLPSPTIWPGGGGGPKIRPLGDLSEDQDKNQGNNQKTRPVGDLK